MVQGRNYTYKRFSRIIVLRLETKLCFYQLRVQAGFRSSFRPNDHLQTVKLLIEKFIESNKLLTLALVDFQTAFDIITQNGHNEVFQVSATKSELAETIKTVK